MASSAVTVSGGLLLAAFLTLTACSSSPTAPVAGGNTTGTASVGATSPPSSTTSGPPTTAAGESPSPTSPPEAGTVRACANTDLSVAVGTGGAGLGHIGSIIVFTNGSAHRCTLFGYPGVTGLDSNGGQVTHALRTLNGYLGGFYVLSTVHLAPGGRASALVEGTTVPTGTATTCPVYPRLLVTAPNQTRSYRLAAGMPGCSPLQIHPVVSGTTGRA